MFEVKIKVEIERLDDILAAFRGFTTALSSIPGAATAVDAPKKRTRKAKAEAEEPVAEPTPDEAPKAAPEAENVEEAPAERAEAEKAEEVPPFDEPKAAAAPATKEEVTDLCKQVAMKAGGNPKVVVELIQAMGFPGLTKVPEDRLGDLAAALRAKLAE